jgi:hypothetical protein
LSCPCGAKAKFKRVSPKCVLTTVGEMTVRRSYFACPACGASQTPLDAWAGLGRRMVSEHARRVLAVAGSSWSFDQASGKLLELCRIRVSNDTIRAVCDEEGERVGRWVRCDDASADALAKAPGEWEFSTDGVKVNTTGGWCEMRLSVLDKRESGPPAAPHEWDRRVLPGPTGRVAWCQVADSRLVGARWAAMVRHLGVASGAHLSVIADGARWIWDQAAARLRHADAEWVVDVYHVSQHLHDCGKAMRGEGPAARAWAEEQLKLLLEQSGPRFVAHVERLARAERGKAPREALRKLLAYLSGNVDRMWYRDRLARGRPIGSGLIEGCCKTVIAARLKINSARWVPRRAERMGHLRCLQYSDLWDAYWNNRAA